MEQPRQRHPGRGDSPAGAFAERLVEMQDAEIKLLLADDHSMLREGLATQPDFEVVGEAATGTEVVRAASSLKPDVILLDLEMPELDGVEVLEQLQQDGSESRTVVFTAYDTDERILGALEAGAKGYLLKGASRTEIFDAIRTIYAGGSLLQPVVTAKLLESMSQSAQREDSESLTLRELEVLALLARGLQNKERDITESCGFGFQKTRGVPSQ